MYPHTKMEFLSRGFQKLKQEQDKFTVRHTNAKTDATEHITSLTREWHRVTHRHNQATWQLRDIMLHSLLRVSTRVFV